MARREDKGSMGSFARGSELWMHQARLFVVAIGTVLLLSVLVGLGVTSGYFWNSTTASAKYALERNVLAHTRDVLGMTAGKMELHVEGRLLLLEVVQVAALTEALAEEGWRKLRNGGLFGALSAAGFVFLVSLYWWGYGRAKMQDRQLRGARLVAGPQCAQPELECLAGDRQGLPLRQYRQRPVPDPAGSDPFWAHAGRMLLKDLIAVPLLQCLHRFASVCISNSLPSLER